MANVNNRTLLIFSAALVFLLVIAVIFIIVGISMLSPEIEDRLSDLPIAQENIGGNFSDRQLAYICCPVDNTVRAVDPTTKRVVATMNFTAEPRLAIPCPDGGDLYVASGNSLYIVDGKGLSTMVNLSYPYPVNRIAFSPDGRSAYIETGDRSTSGIRIINTATKDYLAQIPDMAGSGSDGMLVSHDGKYLYLADHDNGSLIVIDLNDLTIVKTILCSQVGGQASDIALSPDGRHIYVGIDSSDELAVISAESLTLEKIIHVPINNSRSVVSSPDGQYVYTTNYDDKKRISTVTVINTSDDTIVKEITIGMYPLCMRISPDGKYLYVCTAYDPVQVINTETLSVVKSLGFVGRHVEFNK